MQCLDRGVVSVHTCSAWTVVQCHECGVVTRVWCLQWWGWVSIVAGLVAMRLHEMLYLNLQVFIHLLTWSQCSSYSVLCTLYVVQCMLYRVHCILYNAQCTTYSVRCTMYDVLCTTYLMLGVFNNNTNNSSHSFIDYDYNYITVFMLPLSSELICLRYTEMPHSTAFSSTPPALGLHYN